jgi:hypothetical protein
MRADLAGDERTGDLSMSGQCTLIRSTRTRYRLFMPSRSTYSGGTNDSMVAAGWAAVEQTSPPAAPVLLGELAVRPIAALSLSDGATVSNPSVAAGDVVALLRLRAQELGLEGRSGRFWLGRLGVHGTRLAR